MSRWRFPSFKFTEWLLESCRWSWPGRRDEDGFEHKIESSLLGLDPEYFSGCGKPYSEARTSLIEQAMRLTLFGESKDKAGTVQRRVLCVLLDRCHRRCPVRHRHPRNRHGNVPGRC